MILFSNSKIHAQSTDQFAPTPILTNQINGQIKARDIGDSRLTSYYYIFNGNRGDVFINVVTSNLNGDIDVFTAKTLKPRTKITVYADSSNNETGRVVYMRQAEQLILRVQGRTPNDDAANFQIKFAGSFQPIDASTVAERPEAPKVESENDGTVKVNSVGTIIESPDDEVETSENENKVDDKKVADRDSEKTDEKEIKRTEIPERLDPTKKIEKTLPEDDSILSPTVVITDNTKAENKENKTDEKSEDDLTVSIDDKPKNASAIVTIERVEETDSESKEEAEAKRLAKISLKVKLKNGDKFQRPMNEVTSVNVIKTILTIVTTDGKIHEFSIFDVSKMTID